MTQPETQAMSAIDDTAVVYNDERTVSFGRVYVWTGIILSFVITIALFIISKNTLSGYNLLAPILGLTVYGIARAIKSPALEVTSGLCFIVGLVFGIILVIVPGDREPDGPVFGGSSGVPYRPQPGINYRSPLEVVDGPSLDELGPTSTVATPTPEDTVPTVSEEPVPTTTTVTTVAPPEEESEEPIPPVEDEPVVPDPPAEPSDPVEQGGSADPEVPTFDPNQSNGSGQVVQSPG